jgi:hypothetical protein
LPLTQLNRAEFVRAKGERRPDWREYLYFPDGGSDGEIPVELHLIGGQEEESSELWLAIGGQARSGTPQRSAEVPTQHFYLVARICDRDLLLEVVVAIEGFVATSVGLRSKLICDLLRMGARDACDFEGGQKAWLYSLVSTIRRIRQISQEQILAVYQANAHPLTTEMMLSWSLLRYLREKMEEKT